MDPVEGSANIFSLLAVVVSVGGGLIAALVQRARASAAANQPAPVPAVTGGSPAASQGLFVSPEIWQRLNDDYSTRIAHLEQTQREQTEQIRLLQRRVEQGETERTALERLLRIAVRALLEANRRLRGAGVPEVGLDPQLAPYTE